MYEFEVKVYGKTIIKVLKIQIIITKNENYLNDKISLSNLGISLNRKGIHLSKIYEFI